VDIYRIRYTRRNEGRDDHIISENTNFNSSSQKHNENKYNGMSHQARLEKEVCFIEYHFVGKAIKG
jgi:hypothetical protein